MKRKNTGNGITPSKDGKSAMVQCGAKVWKVRYEGKKVSRKADRKV